MEYWMLRKGRREIRTANVLKLLWLRLTGWRVIGKAWY